MNARKLLLDVGGARTAMGDLGLLVLRLFAGLALAIAHGWGKLPPSDRFVERVGTMQLPVPEVFAWLAGIAEIFGALLVAVGLLTRPTALFVTFHFLIVVFMAHAGDTFLQRERAALFLVIYAMLVLTGPGRYSLDAMIAGRSWQRA